MEEFSEGEMLDESSSVIYDDQEEPAADYKPGGYHPLNVNDVLFNRYQMLQKVGWGHFSTVWLSKDLKHNTYVAVKVQKSAEHYTEAAYDEIDMLLKISKSYREPAWVQSLYQYTAGTPDGEVLVREGPSRDYCYVVQLLNSFMHTGPNGKHVCMVFEILGVNLLEIIKLYNYKGIPMPICRAISKQVLVGLDYMHRICGLIHTDLKPENVLVELTKAQLHEIFRFGVLKKKIDRHLPLNAVETHTPLNAQVPLSKKEKRKLYRQRRKEREKALKTVEPDQVATEVQPSKKRKRKRNKQAPTEDTTDKKSTSHSEDKPKPVDFLPEVNAQSIEESKGEGESPESLITEHIRVKIADIGNACWTHNHFSTEIQTRQYRSPEVILGITYNHTADIWSFACMLFELITGDFLFDPRSDSGFDKEDDHLAQMIETLGFFPRHFSVCGRDSRKYFKRNGQLRNIRDLRIWPLKAVLMEKYRIKEAEAAVLSDFLLPMLIYEPERRATAQDMLKHRWLHMPANYDCRMTEKEFWENSLKLSTREHENKEKLKRGESPVFDGIRPQSSDADCDVEDNADWSDYSSSASDVQAHFEENLEYHNEMLRFREFVVNKGPNS